MAEKTKKMNDVQKDLKKIAKGLKNNKEGGDKKERILTAAEMIFAEKGYFETTVSEIAKEAGVAEGTIYEYFENKKDLLYAVPEQNTIEYADFVLNHLQGIKGATNKLRKIIWCQLHYFRTHRNYTKIVTLEIRRGPDYFKSKAYENLKLYSDLILSIVREGIKDGEIAPDVSPHITRDMILGTIEHISIPWIVFGREIPIEDLVEDICNILFTGLFQKERTFKVNMNGIMTGFDGGDD